MQKILGLFTFWSMCMKEVFTNWVIKLQISPIEKVILCQSLGTVISQTVLSHQRSWIWRATKYLLKKALTEVEMTSLMSFSVNSILRVYLATILKSLIRKMCDYCHNFIRLPWLCFTLSFCCLVHNALHLGYTTYLH